VTRVRRWRATWFVCWVRYSGSHRRLQGHISTATLRCGQYDGIWAQVWCECPTKPIRSFAAARMAGAGPVAGLYCELANAGFWQKRPAVVAAERLLTEAALKHACTEPLVLAQKSGCYSLADVFAPKPPSACHRLELRSISRRPVPLELRGVASALGQTAASRTSFVRSVRRKPLLFNANTQTKAFVAPGRDLITFLLVCGDAADIRHEHTGFPRDIGADVP